MKTYYGSDSLAHPLTKAVVALGNFDGVHLGHQYLLAQARKRAEELQGQLVVYTFSPHPAHVLAPQKDLPLIQTPKQKLRTLENLGVDVCIVEKFSKEFALERPENFVKNILMDLVGAVAVVVGYDFTFGFHRSGSVEQLEALGEKYLLEVEIVPAKFLDEMLLSSSKIRTYIREGEVGAALKMLGRPYTLVGKVIKGEGRGGQLGFHTANIEPENMLLPGSGVYLTKTKIETHPDQWWKSVTSIGFNPTFHQGHRSIETHLLDFEEQVVDKKIEVEFLDKIRDQIAFSAEKDLSKQIGKDVEMARKTFKRI
ncbi:MAG: bifunctional riboflavin kinase/FAD synthetase [Pseudomonadota bacterium]